MKLGAIEAGGTKFVLAIGNERGELYEKISIPTKTPEETLSEALAFFQGKGIEALGVGAFGPLELNKDKDNYGFITSTPKPHWANIDLLGILQRGLSVPVALATDVSGAALGEVRFGDYKEEHTLLYITVGTGIGGGYTIAGKIHNGMLHPEMGHLLVHRHPKDSFEGLCPYHKSCLEGMASGPANEAQTGMKGVDIPEDHESFDFIASYMADALMSYILTLSPTKIVLGGGVMGRTYMLPKIRQLLAERMNGYLKTPQMDDLTHYIVTPSLGVESGIKGALALAMDAL